MLMTNSQNFKNNNSNKIINMYTNKKLFGTWLYLMSDVIFFAVLFAVYAVMLHNSVKNISKEIFNLMLVFVETSILLSSSISFGLSTFFINLNKKKSTIFWLIVTLLLGSGFVLLEVHEFFQFLDNGYSPQNNSFLSIFFTIVGVHGLHVFIGLIWILWMIIQIQIIGLNTIVKTRIKCLGLFWHFLDIIWVFVFTFVYLIGVVIT